MLSSMSRHFDANMLKRIGIAHYLHKPVAQRELHQVIAGILVPTPVVTTAPAPVAAPVRDQTGLHILLAEDNLVNQKVARRLLEQLGSPLRGGEQRPGGAGALARRLLGSSADRSANAGDGR
jgi:CheY-like chemotaxis protein